MRCSCPNRDRTFVLTDRRPCVRNQALTAGNPPGNSLGAPCPWPGGDHRSSHATTLMAIPWATGWKTAMPHLQAIPVAAQSIERYRGLVGDDRLEEATIAADTARARLAGRVFWNVSSTARGGGVAEMLPTLIAYARGT